MTLTGTLSRPWAAANLLPADRVFWGALAVIAAIVPPWGAMVSVEIYGLPHVMVVVAAILLLRAGYVAVRPGAQVVHTLLETGAGIIAYTAILAPVSYLCARNAMPLFDQAFQSVDRMIGYDWQAWADYEHGTPALEWVLRLAYASLLPQMVLVLALLPMVGDGRRGFSMIRASLIAVIIACAGSFAFPAAGPDAIHTDWYPHWAALRTIAPFATSLPEVQGIIAFPSFHASLAVLLFYFVLGLGPLTWAFGALELLMLISTPTFGHHYLSDVVAGIAVSIVAIWLTDQLDRRFPPIRPPRRETGRRP